MPRRLDSKTDSAESRPNDGFAEEEVATERGGGGKGDETSSWRGRGTKSSTIKYVLIFFFYMTQI